MQLDPRDALMKKLGYGAGPMRLPPNPAAAMQPTATAPAPMAPAAAPAPAPTALPPAPRLPAAPTAPATAAPAPAPAPATAPAAGAMQPASTGTSSWAAARGLAPAPAAGQQAYWSGIETEDDKRELTDYINLLYSMPDYQGRHERNQGMIAMKAQEIRDRAKQGKDPLDLYGLSRIGDLHDSQQDQLMALMSARGIGGSGIEGGGLSNLAGKFGQAQGQFISDQTSERRRENLQRDLEERRMLMQMLMQSADANAQEQADPGFLGDVLGFAGSALGAFGGGYGQALGSRLGG